MKSNNKYDNLYKIFKTIGLNISISTEKKRTKILCFGFFSNIIKKFILRELNYFNNKKYIFEITKKNKNIYKQYYNIYGNSLIFSTWIPPIPSKPFSRLLKSRILSLFNFNTSPEQLTISIIEDCPNKCIHCALPNKYNHSTLKIDILKKIINNALKCGFTSIIFDGGEPLLYDELEEAISFVDKSKAVACLFTSGYGLNLEKAKKLKGAGLYSISISIDSAIEAIHDKMRGRSGSYKDAINGIKCSIEAGILVNMYCVLTPNNICELEKIYNLATLLKVNELSFYEIVPTGRWIDHMADILSYSDKKKYFDFVDKFSCKEGPKIFSGPHIIKEFGCMAGNKWIHITPEGLIQPCSCIPISYGNIYNNSLSKVIKKIKMNTIYKNNYDCLMRSDNFRTKLNVINKLK